MLWSMVIEYALFTWVVVGGCSVFLWPYMNWRSDRLAIAVVVAGGPIAWLVAAYSAIKNRRRR